ncbi:class I SAM-dependent methyltransferase [Chloroflexota bacterium]
MPKEGRRSRELYVKYLRRLAPYVFAGECVVNKSILEIGCGTTGYGAAHLSGFASSVVAVDTRKDAIAYCQTEYQRGNLTFLVADGTVLPFKDRSFDMVLSFQVIEHIEPKNVLDYLSEVRRVLRHEGIFGVSTPNSRLTLLPFQKRPSNPAHRKEYKGEELQMLLCNYFLAVKVCGLYGSREVLSIERSRVKPKPVKVYIIRPYRRLLHQLYQLLSNLSPPPFRHQLESVREAMRKFSEPKEPITEPVLPGKFLSEFSFNDFTLDPACPEDSLDLIGICTKK